MFFENLERPYGIVVLNTGGSFNPRYCFLFFLLGESPWHFKCGVNSLIVLILKVA